MHRKPLQPPLLIRSSPIQGKAKINGLAERSVRTVEDQTRTVVAALEASIQTPIVSDHQIIGWLAEHARYVLNKYAFGANGKTPVGRSHGCDTSKTLCEPREKRIGCVRSKLDGHWRHGIVQGRSMTSDQSFIGVAVCGGRACSCNLQAHSRCSLGCFQIPGCADDSTRR